MKIDKNIDRNNLFRAMGIVLIFVGIISSPFISVLLIPSNSFISGFDLTKEGLNDLATTVSGLTAPAIGLIGAVLVYVSFHEQVKANKIQFEAFNDQKENDEKNRNFDRLNSLFEQVVNNYNNLKYDGYYQEVEGEIYYGDDALNKYTDEFILSGSHLSEFLMDRFNYLRSIRDILRLFKLIVTNTKDVKLNELDEKILTKRIATFYSPIFVKLIGLYPVEKNITSKYLDEIYETNNQIEEIIKRWR